MGEINSLTVKVASDSTLKPVLILQNVFTACNQEYLSEVLILMNYTKFSVNEGFPDNSVGKESACNAGDPSSIPGSGRSTGERIGYPLQYSWASLVAQLV